MRKDQSLIFISLFLLFFACAPVPSEIHEVKIDGSRSTYIFSLEGEEKLEVNFDDKGNLFSVVTRPEHSTQALFFYGENGALKSKTILRKDGGIVGREYFFFKKSGILKSYFDYRDTIPYQGVLFYDTVGTERTILFFDEYGELEEKTEISRNGETIISYGKDSIMHSIEPVN